MALKMQHHTKALIRVLIFGLFTAIFGTLSIVSLAANSQGAKQRYDTLIAVDQAGGDVAVALDDLRIYIFNHMNTQIGSDNGIRPPIQLKGTYDRLVAEEEARVASSDALYAEAQADCELRQPTGFSGRNRLDCIEAYIDAHPKATPKQIEESKYKFDFVPPRWSPDLAGFSIVLLIIFGLIFLIDLLLYLKTRNMLRLSK